MSKEHDLKPKIIFYKNVQRIVESLKMIAAVKSKQFLLKYHNANQFLYHYTNNLSQYSLPNNKNGQTLHIIVGANKGLCGNYLTQLSNLLKTLVLDGSIILIGNKMPAVIKHIPKEKIIKHFPLEYSKENIKNICAQIKSLELSNCYVHAWDTVTKTPITEQWLDNIELEDMHLKFQDNTLSEEEVTVILTNILYSKINKLIISAIQMEETCRLYAMDQAVKNGKNIIADLNSKINQARQQGITTELNEIISGCEYAN